MDDLVQVMKLHWLKLVYRSCAHKARIVANDEKEQGERALLNFGHTFGHAIESYGAMVNGSMVKLWQQQVW